MVFCLGQRIQMAKHGRRHVGDAGVCVQVGQLFRQRGANALRANVGGLVETDEGARFGHQRQPVVLAVGAEAMVASHHDKPAVAWTLRSGRDERADGLIELDQRACVLG
ncbi:hypothetical protein D9M72_567760 [compost metagenome]